MIILRHNNDQQLVNRVCEYGYYVCVINTGPVQVNIPSCFYVCSKQHLSKTVLQDIPLDIHMVYFRRIYNYDIDLVRNLPAHITHLMFPNTATTQQMQEIVTVMPATITRIFMDTPQAESMLQTISSTRESPFALYSLDRNAPAQTYRRVVHRI